SGTPRRACPTALPLLALKDHKRGQGRRGRGVPRHSIEWPGNTAIHGGLPMLVLSRRRGESIVINNDITLTVVEIRGDKVRLGIISPPTVPVHRQEVFDAIHGLLPPAPAHAPRPPEMEPFLHAVQEEPGDAGTRLVFADWLEERGDPLGE